MENLTYRKAIQEDIAECAKIISSDHAWTIYGVDYEKAISILMNMEDVIYIAENSKEIVGFITLRINGMGNFGSYIRMVVVKHECRNQGIGRKLLRFIEKIAFMQNKNLFLICSQDNLHALRFYEHMGFFKVCVLPDLIVEGHNEILLQTKFVAGLDSE